MSCGQSILKTIIGIFNTVVALLGLACIIVGALCAKSANLEEISHKVKTGDLFSGAYLIIAVGSIIFIVAMIGCCGAIQESKCLLMTYFVIVAAVVIVEFVGAGLAWKNSSKLKGAVEDALMDGIKEYQHKNETRKFIDYIQKNLECCGVNSKSDYNKIKPPPSCVDKDAKVYETGCLVKVDNFLMKVANGVGGLAIGLTLAQILSLVMVLCLFCSLRKTENVV